MHPAPIHIRIGHLRLPHLPPGSEAFLRDEIYRELNRILAEDCHGQPFQPQAKITISCSSRTEATNPRLIARQIAQAIRQSANRRG